MTETALADNPSSSATRDDGSRNPDSASSVHENESIHPKPTDPRTSLGKGEDAKGEVLAASSVEPVYITGFKLYAVLGSVTATAFLLMLDMTIIVAAIPEITTVFHSLEDVGWYGAAYTLSSAALQPMAGKIYSHFSTKWSFCAFLLLFEIGSLICGAANSSDMLIVGRAIAGMGSSGLFNGAMTVIAAVAPMSKRPTLLGIMMGISQMGLVVGPLIGGSLTEYSSWRWCFYINLPVGAVVVLVLIIIHVPDHLTRLDSITPRSLAVNLDIPGFLLFAPAAVMFLLALENGSTEWGWSSGPVIGLFVAAGVTAIGFLFWEYRAGDKAMLPYSMVRKRIVWSSAVVNMSTMGSVYLASYYTPIYFQSVKGVGPFDSGLYLLPVILSQLIMAVSSGFLISKIGYYLPLAVVSTMLAAVGGGLVSTWAPDTSTDKWIGYQIILGMGRGLGLQIPLIAVQNSIPAAQLSVGMALLVFAQTFGGAILLTVGNLIFSDRLRANLVSQAPNVNATAVIEAGGRAFRQVVQEDELPSVLEAYADSINAVFYLVAAVSVLGFFFTWGIGWKDIREKKKTPGPGSEESASENC